jgi:hypothetical protein
MNAPMVTIGRRVTSPYHHVRPSVSNNVTNRQDPRGLSALLLGLLHINRLFHTEARLDCFRGLPSRNAMSGVTVLFQRTSLSV